MGCWVDAGWIARMDAREFGDDTVDIGAQAIVAALVHIVGGEVLG